MSLSKFPIRIYAKKQSYFFTIAFLIVFVMNSNISVLKELCYCSSLLLWETLCCTKRTRGCQVIARNFLTFFSFDFSHKTIVFGRMTLYCCHKISGEDVMSLSQNFILGSLQHIPYQRSLSYYHFILFFLSIFHKKYPGFSRTSPNSFVESFIAEIVAATDPSNDNPPVA